MNLYLLRHAQASAGTDDSKRHLTRKGRKDARALGETLRSRFHERMVHSRTRPMRENVAGARLGRIEDQHVHGHEPANFISVDAYAGAVGSCMK